VLPPGHRPLKVLHVSDLHLTPDQGMKRRWLASLADLEPDLVVNTGDNLAHQDSVGPLRRGLRRLLDVPGVFVFGSNDYFAPTLRNPLWYLSPTTAAHTHTPKLPWQDLRAAFESAAGPT
jgi:predicted MPP superfamily phosphohydrolase